MEIQDAPYRLEISNQLIVRPPGNGQLLWVGWHFSASLSSLASYSWPRSGILRTKDDPAMKISNPATQTDAFLSGSKKGDRVWPVSVALGMDEDVPRYEMPGAEQDRERTESQRIFKDLEKTVAEALFSDGRGQLTGYFPASSHPRLSLLITIRFSILTVPCMLLSQLILTCYAFPCISNRILA